MPPAAIFYIIESKNAAQYRQTAAPTAERLNAKPKEQISRVMSENAPQRPSDPPCVWNASENTSLFQEPAVEFKSTLSPQCDVAIGVFLIITGSLSLLGNGVVVITFSRRCKRLKPPELMAVNLAVCDFGYSLLGAPLLIYSSFSHAWWFGWRGCRWYGVQGFVFGIGSLLTTMLISIDRCLKICSIRYGQWVEQRHVALLVLLVWIYTTAWAILPVLGFGSYGPEPFGISCTIDWWKIGSSPLDRLYVILIMVFCFGVPVLTIILCYLKIIWEVRASSRSLAEISASDVTASDKEMRLTKIGAVICSSFLLAWTPYVIVSLYSMLLPPPPAPLSSALPSLSVLPALFAKSHCMLNPFIYQLMNREFRRDVRSLFGLSRGGGGGSRGGSRSLYYSSSSQRQHRLCRGTDTTLHGQQGSLCSVSLEIAGLDTMEKGERQGFMRPSSIGKHCKAKRDREKNETCQRES